MFGKLLNVVIKELRPTNYTGLGPVRSRTVPVLKYNSLNVDS